MLDLVSTRWNTDESTAKCARLIAAVIAQAIQDACIKPSVEEQKSEQNINSDARDAIDWLFDESQIVFTVYCRLIGANALTIRQALLEPGPENAFYSSMHRRIIRARFAWWRKTQETAARQQNKPG